VQAPRAHRRIAPRAAWRRLADWTPTRGRCGR
jgi:hypothetical protein